jgi:tetratricopeptide (TPR) repeat protein
MALSRVFLIVSALAAAPSLGLAQDWTGMGRLEGRVSDPDGNPIVGVSVKLDHEGGGGPTATTDKKGRWAVGGIASGAWDIDFTVDGFVPKKIQVVLSAAARLPPIKLQLDKPAGPPPEVKEALEKGDAAYKAGDYAEARINYQKLLELRPEFATTLHQQIARCYYQEGNYEKELEHLQYVLDAEPDNASIKVLMAQEALKGGMLERGLELLNGIDESTITDPDVFFNIAILFLNQQKAEDAIPYLTKAVTLSPTYVDGYFQRALAYLQLQKLDEAKADFQKVVELDPDGPKAETSKKALEQLK